MGTMNNQRLREVEAVFHTLVFDNREKQWFHMSYDEELITLDLIRNGDVEGVQKRIQQVYEMGILDTHLSINLLRRRKYELVAAVSVVSRIAIEAGLDVETAYSLSDSYIRVADNAKTVEDLLILIKNIPLDYAERIRNLRQKQPHSKTIMHCIEYIEGSLHYDISLADLAAHTGKNESYLSNLFKQETGLTLREYLTGKRLEAAKEMLAHRGTPISQISSTLSFSSQSYFTLVFRKRYGITPQQFRAKYFRQHHSG
jgi:AraC-like DNA-binding protein